MSTIIERMKKDGTPRFTALVRKKKNSKVLVSITETFSNERAAKRWMKLRESKLKKKGAVERIARARERKTRSHVIDDYTNASPAGFGKTKTANLAYLQRMDFGASPVDNTCAHDFVTLAQDLLNGVQAPPADPERNCPEHLHLETQNTTDGAFLPGTLRTVVNYGGPPSKIEMPIGEFEVAIRTMKHHKMVRKSASRNRRPTLGELDKLISYFYYRYNANPLCVPMHMVIAGAIFLGHRQNCALFFALVGLRQ